jgi:hypothetical protein
MPFNPKLALATVLTACVVPLGAVVAGAITHDRAKSSDGASSQHLIIPSITIGR